MTSWAYRSVAFDLDGLLIDTEPIFAEAARRLVVRRGKTFDPEVLNHMMGTPARQAVPVLRDRHGLTESVDDLIVEGRELFLEVLGAHPVRLLPGAIELLDRLRAKRVPLALATSSTARYVAQVAAPLGILPRFAFVLTADDVKQGKPFPEMYEKAAAILGHEPAAMVVFEDSPNGLRAAKAAGARCVVVPHPLVPADRLADADAVLTSLEEPRLRDLLGL